MAAPVFDAAAISAIVSLQTNTFPISWSHTVGAGANNCGIVAVVNANANARSFVPTGTPTASIGATSLTYLGTVSFNNNGNLGWTVVWAGLAVPTGSQTVSTSITDIGQQNLQGYGASFTYTGAGGLGGLQTAFGVNASPSLSVPSAPGNLVWGLVGDWNADTLSAFSLTSRQSQTVQDPVFVGGDGAGSSSVTVSATVNTAREWGVVGLNIFPFVATPAASFNQAIPRVSLY